MLYCHQINIYFAFVCWSHIEIHMCTSNSVRMRVFSIITLSVGILMKNYVLWCCTLLIIHKARNYHTNKPNLTFSVIFLLFSNSVSDNVICGIISQRTNALYHIFWHNKVISTQKNLIIFSIRMEMCASYILTHWPYFQNK
jgi:hypothetical protein